MSATKHQYLHELVEDYSIRYARPVAAEWMVHFSSGQQVDELFPDRLDEVCWHSGHRLAPSFEELE